MFFKKIILVIIASVSPLCSLCKVYFTPRDDIKSQLIQLIKAERKSIHGAMYMLTDKIIAQTLIDAYVRGVDVNIILDQISMTERFGKGQFLQNNGITIFVHKTEYMSSFSMPLMHHKFFIFGLNGACNKSLLWTGSFNCSVAAATIHDENVLVTDDQYAITEYRNCFKQLAIRLGGTKNVILDEPAIKPIIDIEPATLEKAETEL